MKIRNPVGRVFFIHDALIESMGLLTMEVEDNLDTLLSLLQIKTPIDPTKNFSDAQHSQNLVDSIEEFIKNF